MPSQSAAEGARPSRQNRILRFATDGIARLVHAWRARARCQRDLADLQSMSERQLNDLGLGSGDLRRITAHGSCGRWED